MFGYVRADSSELKVKEYELYRSVYCGLCRSMGKCTGQCSRMTLSYDFAFLALLRLSAQNVAVGFRRRRCLAHPLKKRSVMEDNEVLHYCSYAAAILSYHKVMDDIKDEKGIKKSRSLIARPFASRWRKKALIAGYRDLDRKVMELLERLSDIEKQKLSSVDAPAAIFGEILGEITSFGLDGAEKRILYQIGVSVGRWIYTVDALDDMVKDGENQRYNPFILLYGGRIPTEEELVGISDVLTASLGSAEAAMDLFEIPDASLRSILENILYLGLPHTADGVVRRATGKKQKGTKKHDE